MTIAKCIAKLDALTNCPVCGAGRNHSLGGHKNRKLFFACGAAFMCDSGKPISALIACPSPSETAAELLNLEIIQDDHVALVKVGAA